jgi:putative Se/S carrier protein
MKYTIVFHTQSGALKFEYKMKKINISCSLQPVPRKLSSSCGICAKLNYDANPKELIEPEIEGIYKEISNNQYEMVYENE